MTPCPECNAAAFVVDSRLTVTGDRRRRFHCQTCGHRWTAHNGPRPAGIRQGATADKQRLSDDAIADILTSADTRAMLAARWGCHISTVKKIQHGTLHALVLPELRRYS